MPPQIPIWERPRFVAEHGSSSYQLVCCARAALAPQGSPLDLLSWSPVNELPDGIRVHLLDDAWESDWGKRIQARHWFPGSLDPSLGSQLHAMRVAYEVAVEHPDGADMHVLQVAWAVTRWFIGSGAFAVFDSAADRWWSGEQIMSWGGHRRFELAREVFFDKMQGSGIEVVVARGLAKFARPDVLIAYPQTDPAVATELLGLVRIAAHRLALGEVLRPGDHIDNGFLRVEVLPFRPDVFNFDVPVGDDTLVLAFPE